MYNFFKNIIFSFLFINIFLIFLTTENQATEITAEDGIEVFQKEKYYLLKKNVKINSNDFILEANIVKAYYDKDLYDIVLIESKGKSKLISDKGMLVLGEEINLDLKNEKIKVLGLNSSIKNDNIEMFSNDSIEINNLQRTFEILGDNSELKNDDIEIKGSIIQGKYLIINDKNEIEYLFAEDKLNASFKTSNIDMIAKKAIYNKQENIIELFENVQITRNDEVIIGDHAIINTLDQSYKVNSNKSNNVKILIKNKETIDE